MGGNRGGMRLEVGDERGCHPGPFDRLRVKLRPGSRFLCTAWMFRLWIPASAGMTKGAGRTMRAGCHPDLLRRPCLQTENRFLDSAEYRSTRNDNADNYRILLSCLPAGRRKNAKTKYWIPVFTGMTEGVEWQREAQTKTPALGGCF